MSPISTLVLGYMAIAAGLTALLMLALQRWGRPADADRAAASCNRRLKEIELKRAAGDIGDAEAEAARVAIVRQALAAPRMTQGVFVLPFRGPAIGYAALGAAAITAAVALGFSGADIGASVPAWARFHSGTAGMATDDPVLARLQAYSDEMMPGGSSPKVSSTPSGEARLPDVETMISRLAARLAANPGDVSGWRTLGWSYFHTGRYDEARAAYAKAVELDSGNPELIAAYDEAKAKAETAASGAASGATADSAAAAGDGVAGLAGAEQDAAIRAMVDGLAARLEHEPRDAEGWIKLMRSRSVLGERETASRALQQALEVFAGDEEPKARISAAAAELGLVAD